MTHAQEFRNILMDGPDGGEFCSDGFAWALAAGSLSKAWRTCPRGSWMAFWLLLYTPARYTDVQAIASRLGIDSVMDSAERASPQQDRRYATALRARFNSDGTTRKRSKR